MSNIPTVRFSGYTDEWSKQKLDDIVSYYNGLTYTPDDVRDTGTLVLRSSNIQSGEIVDADNVYVAPEAVNVSNVRLGDIVVVVRNGSRALLGKHAEVKVDCPNTVIGAFMTGMRSECPSFTNALLDTKHFEEEIALNLGATINQITGYMFSQMEFKTPTMLQEREKLGIFFRYIDSLLDLHQRKLDIILSMRKSMLQKMFPRNGSKVPEIRFKGFEGEWTSYKLGDLFEQSDVKNTDCELGVDKTISVASMRFKQEGNGAESPQYYKILRYGDIAFEGNRRPLYPYGKLIMNDIGDGIMSSRFRTFRPKKPPCTCFWHHYMVYPPVFQRILMMSTKRGTLMNELVPEDLLKQEVLLPSESEQEAIGSFLNKLDQVINLQQLRVDNLKKVKKSLLARMFV